MQTLKKMWDERPIILIMTSAILFRIIAVIYAKGYGMSDDHFLVLEWAKGWLDGGTVDRSPAGHSLVYPGLHYLLFILFKKIGLFSPDSIMYVVRFLHAALSMITIYFGYKIVLLRSSKKIAAEVGLLLAVLWLFPFMSVRNLIEVVCIPFLMMAAYCLVKYENSKKQILPLIAGLILGIAFTFRYQTNLFILGFFLLLLIRREFIAGVFVALGFLTSSFLIQGLTDWFAYGYPYASFIHYFLDNKANAYNYITGTWYVYIFTIIGVLIPPTSLLIMFGFVNQWRRWALLFWPTVIFLAFHSTFPNKQERFILPAIPFVLMLGIAGWREFAAQSKFWQKHVKLHSGLWKWFWIVNCVLLIVVSTTYSKRARVEVMNFLHSRQDVNAILVETSDADAQLLPLFYLGKKVPIYNMTRYMPVDSVRSELMSKTRPNYLVMMNIKRMEERQKRLRALFPKLEKITEIQPGLMDQVLHFLNPRHNVNQRCVIYRIE